ncbi:unnamed protein product, partial [Tilletia laevis]
CALPTSPVSHSPTAHAHAPPLPRVAPDAARPHALESRLYASRQLVDLLPRAPAHDPTDSLLEGRNMVYDRKGRSYRHKAATLAGVAAALYANRFLIKEAGHARYGHGYAKVRQWLTARGSTGREMLGMRPETFQELLRLLKGTGKLSNSRNITATERLGIFLYMSRFATSCRQAADVFGHSPVTIGRSFKIVIRALLDPQLYQKYISLPSRLQEVPTRIKEDPALYPFFKTVIGAIDGSHVPAHAPVHMRDRFWNRKGYTSFNVLAACDFDMKIMYILSGWEGSTSDSFLWKKALGSGLRLRGKERLLGDAGFPLSQRLLIPYRGVRYHLKEFGTGMQR